MIMGSDQVEIFPGDGPGVGAEHAGGVTCPI